MTIYSSFLMLMALIGLFFGAFVYINGKGKARNIILALYNIIFSVWCFGQFMGEIAQDPGSVLFWTRVNLAAAVFIPVVFLNFIYAFLQNTEKRKKTLFLFYFLGAMFLFLIPTPYFVRGLASTKYFRYYPQGGAVYAAFAAAFIFQILLGFYELIRAFIDSKGSKRNQISYIILASIVGYVGGVLWFLPAFGVDVYPFGIFIVPFYIFIAAYAVVKHRLLDIKIAVKRSIVYTILIALFSGIYVLFLALIWKIFRTTTGINSLIPGVAVLFCFALLFDPARRAVQDFVDRIFGGRYDYESTLKDLSRAVVSAVRTRDFSNAAAEAINKAMKVSGVAVFLADSRKNCFCLTEKIGFGGNLENSILFGNPLSSIKKCVVCEELEEGPLKDCLNKMKVSLAAPMIINDSLIGLILIGRKMAEDVWSEQDISLFATFSLHAAVAAQNAMLCEEIMRNQFTLYQAEKSAAIGTIAASMAHEIKNPLTAMKGMVAVLPQNIGDKEFIESFEDIIPRQIDRINMTLEKLLRLARTGASRSVDSGVIVELDIEKIIDDISALLKAQCEKSNIAIIKKINYPLKVEFEKEEVTQVLLNIMLNAVQAMPAGGVISVETDKDRIKISDTGAGIKKEHLNNIFEPFFTTKADGAGLGLSTVYRIINDMGGALEVASIEGKGTTFSIKFKKESKG